MTSIAGTPQRLGGLAEKGADISRPKGPPQRSGRGIRPSEPDGAVEGEAWGTRRMDDECLRDQRGSRRPGQAKSAAAERARLMEEIDALRKALALTRRLMGDGDDAPVAKDADHIDLRGREANREERQRRTRPPTSSRSDASPLWPSGHAARGRGAERGARPSAPGRPLLIPA